MAQKLELGRTVVTIGVDSWMSEDPTRRSGIVECLIRHSCGDWGSVCDEDSAANEEAVARDERVLSAYEVGERRLWVITEWDRSVTTVLFPEEY